MTRVRTVIGDETAFDAEYTLVVALANPERVDQLMRTALDVARSKDGEIVIVSVIHKTPTSPFLLFSTETINAKYAGESADVLESAAAVAADAGVPVRRRLLVSSDVSGAILSAIDDVDADAALLGWQEQPRPSDIVLGTTVDSVIHRAPCDVFVERVGTTANGVESILFPTVDGPHVEPAAELAAAVSAANDATVTVVSYVAPGAAERERAAALDHVTATAERIETLPTKRVVEHQTKRVEGRRTKRVDGRRTKRVEGPPVETHVREATDVARRIVTAADDHDLVVLGATRERSLRRRVVGSVAKTVGREATPPVVIAKRRRERSLLSVLTTR